MALWSCFIRRKSRGHCNDKFYFKFRFTYGGLFDCHRINLCWIVDASVYRNRKKGFGCQTLAKQRKLMSGERTAGVEQKVTPYAGSENV